MTNTDLRLQDAILDCLGSTYRLEDGSTVQGQSISYLSQSLRDKGWKGVSNLNDLEDTAHRLGFKTVRGQLTYSDGRGAKPFARVITL